MVLPFQPADILLPRAADMSRWSVVACDQYTSEPQYWREVERYVGAAKSTLRLILPEVYLEEPGAQDRVAAVNSAMQAYLSQGVFEERQNTYVYLERRLRGGGVRRGVVGALDLERYDYRKGARSDVRATEETVLSRIPPRVDIRRNAPLELPHIMVLIDDPGRTVIEPLSPKKAALEQAYGFELMQNSGAVEGFFLDAEAAAGMEAALAALARGQTASEDGFLFAVGDGNHSLASAKQCYEDLKLAVGREAAERRPARYALVEMVNLHDDTLRFEAIHRVLFGVDPEHLLAELAKAYRLGDGPRCQRFTALYGRTRKTISLADPPDHLAVASLQRFIDSYVERFGGRVDYVHGDGAAAGLAAQPDTLAFLLPAMEKRELFPAVAADGALPRKTFSMGHAWDKRFYLEGRKIQ